MFIRKKRNKSGSISVQLILKVGRTNKVIKSVGVGSSDREIELLMSIARLELEKRLKQNALFHDPKDILIDSFVSSIYNEDITQEGPDSVFASLSVQKERRKMLLIAIEDYRN